MLKNLLKITVLLAFICCTTVLHMDAGADRPSPTEGETEAPATENAENGTEAPASPASKDAEKTDTKGEKQDVPDKGVTLVLRAPTSENYQLVKYSKRPLGETKEEIVKGMQVVLPKDTRVRFIVDQVNTLLYDVKIAVEVDGQPLKATTKDPNKLLTGEAVGNTVTASEKAEKALNTLKSSVEEIKKQHTALNGILYRTEDKTKRGSFYENPVDNFSTMKGEAKEKIEKLLELKDGVKEILKDLPKELSDTTETVFEQAQATLDAIEKTEWLQRDTQDRVLNEQIKYTCTFIPKDATAQLKPPPIHVVTVIRSMDLQGLMSTVGPLISEVRDENYVIRENKIALGSMDRWSKGVGVLVHLPVYSGSGERFRYAFALSGGLPAQVTVTDDRVTLGPGPATVGISLLFAGHESDSLISLTGGFMSKSVKRLKGYSVGKAYPPDQLKSVDGLTEKVNRYGVFGAITFSYDVLNLLHLDIIENK